MTKRNSTYTLSSKPCDIEYRMKRAVDLAERLEACLRSIDPVVFPEGTLAALTEQASALVAATSGTRSGAPTKRVHTRRKGVEAQPVVETAPSETQEVTFVEEDLAAE
jgi:hypothetical protein